MILLGLVLASICGRKIRISDTYLTGLFSLVLCLHAPFGAGGIVLFRVPCLFLNTLLHETVLRVVT